VDKGDAQPYTPFYRKFTHQKKPSTGREDRSGEYRFHSGEEGFK